MSDTAIDRRGRPQPIHGLLLAFPIAFSTGAVLSDVAYLNSAEMQWSIFASWLIAFTVVFGALTVLRSLFDLIAARRDGRAGRVGVYTVLVALLTGLALVNSFQHAKDGWLSVGPLGMTLSIVTALIAIVVGWMFHSGWTVRESAQ